jgi:hypothetical protein
MATRNLMADRRPPAAEPANRTKAGKFRPGVSGNPFGRPKSDEDIKALARAHTVEAIDRLLQVLRGDNDRAAVAACSIILDRGWGKAPQATTGDDSGPLVVNIMGFGDVST